MTALARIFSRLRHPRVDPAPDWWGPACTCPTCVPRDARADLHATLRAETRYDAEWPDVRAAEAGGWAGGDLAAMAAPPDLYLGLDWRDDDLPTDAPLPGMARDALGDYAEPARGRHRQTDPADLLLADLRDLGGL